MTIHVDVVLLAIGVLCFLGVFALALRARAIFDWLRDDEFPWSEERDRIDAITELNRRRRMQ